jgi:lincosamide nucleotidyltransferase A/C/D/E
VPVDRGTSGPSAKKLDTWTVASISEADVVELLAILAGNGIEVWLNGGWGVDALLGHQTREHEDLDITISAADRDVLTAAMKDAGFSTYRVDNDFNWVLVDRRDRLVDVHLVDFTETASGRGDERIYGAAGLPFEVGSLEGRGTVAGKSVRCETAAFQVRGHTFYTPDEQDYRDVAELCDAFGIELPHIFRDLGFR